MSQVAALHHAAKNENVISSFVLTNISKVLERKAKTYIIFMFNTMIYWHVFLKQSLHSFPFFLPPLLVRHAMVLQPCLFALFALSPIQRVFTPIYLPRQIFHIHKSCCATQIEIWSPKHELTASYTKRIIPNHGHRFTHTGGDCENDNSLSALRYRNTWLLKQISSISTRFCRFRSLKAFLILIDLMIPPSEYLFAEKCLQIAPRNELLNRISTISTPEV